jgi:phosphoribosylformylglycinamidine cyclo-ligase
MAARSPTRKMKAKPSQKAYSAAGVDVDLSNRIKSGIAQKVGKSTRKEVLSKIGGFGGLFSAKFPGCKDPVLVSSIDGVGTKLKVASMTGRHFSIGSDLVNHCVNDIAVTGAEPLFFLDYYGTGKLQPEVFNQVIAGIVRACKEAGCALIGGETAQMPGLYQLGDYDLVGTIIGIVDKKKIIDGAKVAEGDVLIGFPSSGLHTNGYSLARAVLFTQLRMNVGDKVPGSKKPLGEELMAIHVNYHPLLKKLGAKVTWKALAHITGGGFVDNIPRVLPKKLNARVQLGTWPQLPIFDLIASTGSIPEVELYQVFNMGIGMVAVVSPADAKKLLKLTKCYAIGSIVKGKGEVELVGLK